MVAAETVREAGQVGAGLGQIRDHHEVGLEAAGVVVHRLVSAAPRIPLGSCAPPGRSQDWPQRQDVHFPAVDDLEALLLLVLGAEAVASSLVAEAVVSTSTRLPKAV